MAATELKEYNAGEGVKRPTDINPYEPDDDFAIIDEDEPSFEANDHKPVAEDSPPNPFSGSKEPETSHVNNTKNDTQPTENNQDTSSTTSPAPTTQSTDKPASTPNSSTPSTPNGSPKPARKESSLKTSSQLSSSGGIVGSASPENERMVLSYNERLKMYEDVLQADILEIHLLRELAWQGIPEAKGLRALYWKVLLNYLPTNKALWESSLARDRKLYQDFVKELVIDPHAESDKQADHPLSLEQDSKWNAFFKDNEILAEIDKDVKRTFPHLHFFNQITATGQTIESPHYHTLKRILFIYAKLNPGIRYVQGMNELLGPIYYTFATDSNSAFKDNAEADAFFCFTNLMSEWRDNFCKTLDKSEVGVVGNMKHLNLMFKDQDPEIWSDLEDKKMNPQFYSFRWITLLLSQEFELPDVLRLWDSLFADKARFHFFYCFCCAMLICVRERLLNGTFADNLKLLQSYPPIAFQVIFSTALSVHDNTYVAPAPRKKDGSSSNTNSTPYTHSSVTIPSPPTPAVAAAAPTTTSKLSIPSLFTKSSPGTSPTIQKDKPQEKSSNISFNLPLGLGKFKI